MKKKLMMALLTATMVLGLVGCGSTAEEPAAPAEETTDTTEGADTVLAEILGAGELPVNSYHHQAVRDLAPGVTKMAISEDGLVEAISVDGQKFAVGVQWHPEFSYENNAQSLKLVQAFVDACK